MPTPHNQASNIASEPMKLDHMNVWRDGVFREPALEMAIDHALLDRSILTGETFARFYTWNQPAVTVGYFHKMESQPTATTPYVRRYTGGGLVEHGEDITFALVFPPGSAPANASSASRYRWIHSVLAEALNSSGYRTTLHGEIFQNGEQPCFQHAVSEDLIDPGTGDKICGGAQRRCKGAVIHQGSIRLPQSLRHLNAPWTNQFLDFLSASLTSLSENEMKRFVTQALNLQRERYGTERWNLRRKESMKIKF